MCRAVPAKKLVVLSALLALSALAFMTWGASGAWSFVLPYRGTKLAALMIVGSASAIATVMFQTVAGNRILTPGVMGIDALFMALQTMLVFTLGGMGLLRIDTLMRFWIECGLLIGATLALFGLLLARKSIDLHRMVLTGIIVGVLLRSITNFMERMIDPNEYAVIQASGFASFSAVDSKMLGVSAALLGISGLAAWRMRHQLDVLSLGRETSVSLGLPYRPVVFAALSVVAVLVSVSTALVGPVTFFGLLVAALAHALVKDHRHAVLLPAAALIASLTLVAGQVIMERVFHFSTPLSAVVEFLGGAVFLLLVFKERAR